MSTVFQVSDVVHGSSFYFWEQSKNCVQKNSLILVLLHNINYQLLALVRLSVCNSHIDMILNFYSAMQKCFFHSEVFYKIQRQQSQEDTIKRKLGLGRWNNTTYKGFPKTGFQHSKCLIKENPSSSRTPIVPLFSSGTRLPIFCQQPGSKPVNQVSQNSNLRRTIFKLCIKQTITPNEGVVD